MKTAPRLLPEFVRVFVVSRTGLPPHFAVLEAESRLGAIGWEEVPFHPR